MDTLVLVVTVVLVSAGGWLGWFLRGILGR